MYSLSEALDVLEEESGARPSVRDVRGLLTTGVVPAYMVGGRWVLTDEGLDVLLDVCAAEGDEDGEEDADGDEDDDVDDESDDD